MRDRVNKEIQGEPVVPTMFFSSRQYEAMVSDLTQRLQGVLIPSKAQTYSTSICPKKQVNNKSKSLLFSGTSKDPEEYLQWESNMENWLQSHKLSKAEKLAQAVSALTRKAREWWLKESTSTTYNKQVLNWRDLKARMHEEFVEKFQSTPIAHLVDLNHELDLRSNPVKGGEDGVILISPNFRDIKDPILETTIGPELDMRPINGEYKTNHEELRDKSTCSRNYTQQGVTQKKNRFKSVSYEEDIQLSIRHTSSEPERDQRLLQGEFQSNQDEPSCEPTCFGNLTHQRSTENWNNVKINGGLEVIQFLNQEIPDCPNLEAHGFNQLQNRFWRSGEAYNQQSEGLESLDKAKKRIGLERKMPWAFGKAHESDGSEEESKALEAKPPDGLGKESHAYEAKGVYNSYTAQEEDATKTHTFKTAQEKEATGLLQGPVKSPPELKPIKRPFHIWCWTCTRKRGLVKAHKKTQIRGL